MSPKRIATGKFFCCLLPPRAVRSPIHKSFGFISWTPGLLYTLASVRPGKPASLSGHLQVSALGSQQPNSNPTLTSFLRKEVIQPHLPIRLPCYDFTPVISPAFGSSLLKGWVTDFGRHCLPWCDGRCVQDPGTYSPRHSDSRLLAIPASCSRVADYNPNWDVIFGICSMSPSRFPLFTPL